MRDTFVDGRVGEGVVLVLVGAGFEEHEEVDDEEEDDGRFEDEHPAIVAVGLEELVEFVEGLEFFVDGFLPVGEVEAGGDGLVDAGEVPVAEEFGAVLEFILEAGEVDADFAEFGEGASAATFAEAADGEVAIGAIHDVVEDAVVDFEFGELEVGEFHEVDDFFGVAGFVDDEGGIPVDDGEVVVVIGEVAAGGFFGFLIGEVGGVAFFGEKGGDGAAVAGEPVFGADAFALGIFHGGGDAEDGVGFFVGEFFDGADQVGLQFTADFFDGGEDVVME